MNSAVDRTIAATQNLLCALEQDSSLLSDSQFMHQLARLRLKHKEAVEILTQSQNQTQLMNLEGFNAGYPINCLNHANYHNQNGHCQHLPAQTLQKNSLEYGAITSSSHDHFENNQIDRRKSASSRRIFEKPEENEPIFEKNYFRSMENGGENSQESEAISRRRSEQSEVVRQKLRSEIRKPQATKETIVIQDERAIAREMARESDIMRREREEQKRHDEAKEVKRQQTIATERRHSRQREIVTTLDQMSEVVEEVDIEETPNANERVTSGSKHRTPPSTSGQTYTLVAHSRSASDLRTTNGRRFGAKRPIPQDRRNDTFTPQVTIPKPFRFTYRQPVGNTYSKRFVAELLEKKTKEEKDVEEAEQQIPPFKASPVPPTTYVAENPLINDRNYAEAIRRKLRANMRKNEKSGLKIKSKSTSNLAARPVPPTTYIRPALSEYYRRQKSASQRAINLLHEASTPPDLKLNAVRSNITFNLRHARCRRRYSQEQREAMAKRLAIPNRRISPPDFRKLHTEMQEKLKHAKAKKPTTIPVPFHFTRSRTSWHRQCLSSSPPRIRPKTAAPFVSTDLIEDFHVQMTHAAKLRASVNRKKLEEFDKSEEYWQYAKEVEAENRIRIAAYLGDRKEAQEDIEMRTAEKRRNLIETSKAYEQQLAEMMERVMNRPLVMERQVALAHKHRFERKYQERMDAVSNKQPPMRIRSASNPPPRRTSANSSGTYSVKSIAKDDHYSDAFESEDSSSEDRKSRKKSLNDSPLQNDDNKSSPGSSESNSTSKSSSKSRNSSKSRKSSSSTSSTSSKSKSKLKSPSSSIASNTK